MKHLKYGDANFVIHRRFATIEAAWDYYMPDDPPAPGVVWPWTGPRHQRFGYGVIYYANTSMLAHRYSYTRFVGPIPDGLVIRHNNDIPIDVNPHNLLPGTTADNARDMQIRGRGRRPDAQLASDIVDLRKKGLTMRRIADQLGCSIATVHRYIHRYGMGD